MRRVVQRAAVDILRKRRETIVDFGDTEDSIAGFMVKYEKEQADEFLNDSSGEGCYQMMERVLELPEKYREPLILTYVHECSGREIARRLRISEGVLRKRLQRGRDMLQRYVEESKAVGENI